MIGFTVTVKFTGGAHGSDVLVNVYTPLFVLLAVAGFHVPVIPLSDVTGNTGTAPPEQIVSEVPKLNCGVSTGFTVTVKFTGGAQGSEVLVNK